MAPLDLQVSPPSFLFPAIYYLIYLLWKLARSLTCLAEFSPSGFHWLPPKDSVQPHIPWIPWPAGGDLALRVQQEAVPMVPVPHVSSTATPPRAAFTSAVGVLGPPAPGLRCPSSQDEPHRMSCSDVRSVPVSRGVRPGERATCLSHHSEGRVCFPCQPQKMMLFPAPFS